MINAKVRVTPFHSGADKPAPINFPVKAAGHADTRGLKSALIAAATSISVQEEVRAL